MFFIGDFKFVNSLARKMFPSTRRITDGDSDSWHGSTEHLTSAFALKRYGSTDSLSSWAPGERAKSEYTLRKMASATIGTARPSAPAFVDRAKLDEAFVRKGLSPQQQPQSETTPTKPNTGEQLVWTVRPKNRTKDIKKASHNYCNPIH